MKSGGQAPEAGRAVSALTRRRTKPDRAIGEALHLAECHGDDLLGSRIRRAHEPAMSLDDDEAVLDHNAHLVHETLPQQRADQGTAGVDGDHADIVLLGKRLEGAAKVDALGLHHDAGHAGGAQAIKVAGRRDAAAQGDHVPPIGLVAQLPQTGKTPARVDGGEHWSVG